MNKKDPKREKIIEPPKHNLLWMAFLAVSGAVLFRNTVLGFLTGTYEGNLLGATGLIGFVALFVAHSYRCLFKFLCQEVSAFYANLECMQKQERSECSV